MTQQRLVLPSAAIDACCLIDLLASGEMEAILRASGFTRQLPSAAQGEIHYHRQRDPSNPGRSSMVPADLTGLIASGLLTVCDPINQQELNRFTHYATVFRSDGESMCLALAEQRGWVVATDDRAHDPSCSASGADRDFLPATGQGMGRRRGTRPGNPSSSLAGHSGARPVQAESLHDRVPVVDRSAC